MAHREAAPSLSIPAPLLLCMMSNSTLPHPKVKSINTSVFAYRDFSLSNRWREGFFSFLFALRYQSLVFCSNFCEDLYNPCWNLHTDWSHLVAFELHSASPHVGGASSAPLVFVENVNKIYIFGGGGYLLDWQSTFQGKLATKALYSSAPGVVSLASSILNHHHYLHHHRCSHHHNQQHW